MRDETISSWRHVKVMLISSQQQNIRTIFPNIQGCTMRVYPSTWSFLVFSVITCRSEKDAYPQQQRGSQTRTKSITYTIQPRNTNETTAEQKRSAYLRACTQNASTNDNLDYLKGQESPDIPLLILHIIERMTQL